ncbi:VOC family protein [Elstera litoralis]
MAFAVRNLPASLDFYRTYAGMKVVHHRTDARVAALSPGSPI